MNIETIRSAIMGILSGNPKDEPMHYGEVYGTWSHLSVNHGLIAAYQTFINHIGDEDLKKLVQEAIEALQEENKQIEELLKSNGIGLPPSLPERPVAHLEDIPPGARFSDPEIAAAVSKDVAEGLVAASTMIGQAIREDIGLMYGQFHMAKAQFGAKMLKLNKTKGWLIPPPLQVKSTES